MARSRARQSSDDDAIVRSAMGRTVVIGGGIIGLLAAYELRRLGEQVIVLDRGMPGAGCSAGTLGWIVPSMSDPLPSPGLTGSMVRWMLRGGGPLHIGPAAMPRLARWLWTFWRHCNRKDYEAGLTALSALNRSTLDCYDELSREGMPFEIHRSRILLVAFDRREIDDLTQDDNLLIGQGLTPPTRVTAAEARAFEPGLSDRIACGLLYPEERHVRPESLCQGVAERLVAGGVEIRSGAEVLSAHRRGRAVHTVEMAGGVIDADRFLIAAGAWSGRLARRFGFRLPVQAGRRRSSRGVLSKNSR